MSYFILAVARVLHFVLNAYMWIVIIAALITWVNPDPYNPIVRFLRGITDPVLYRIRRWIPFVVISGIDLSPIVVILAVQILDIVIVGNLSDLAMSMSMR